jgi:hypothetical protein
MGWISIDKNIFATENSWNLFSKFCLQHGGNYDKLSSTLTAESNMWNWQENPGICGGERWSSFCEDFGKKFVSFFLESILSKILKEASKKSKYAWKNWRKLRKIEGCLEKLMKVPKNLSMLGKIEGSFEKNRYAWKKL